MDHVTIRLERDGDEPGIAAAHIEAWLASVESEGARVLCVDHQDWIQQRRIRLAAIGEASTLVAEVGDVIVGHLTWGRCPGSGYLLCRIWSCYVHPDHWGTGIADQLLLEALRALKGLDVELDVALGNARARRFYERHGFRPVGSDLHFDARRPVRYRLDRSVSSLHAPLSNGTIGVCTRASTDLPAPE